MKTWLKGGLIGGVFSILYYLLFSITQMLMLNLDLGIIFYPLLPLIHFIMFDENFISTYFFIFLLLFFVFLYGFVIGSFIGFVIGKIKEHKR